MTTTAQADLKATLEASLFYTETLQRIQEAKSGKELKVIAKAMNTPQFFALPDDAAEELAYQHSLRHYTLSGAGA